jgi:pilus assembly protein CpaE
MADETPVRGRLDAGSTPRTTPGRSQSNANIVLIAPDEGHRRSLTQALEAQHSTIAATLSVYPNYNHLLTLVELDFDAAVVELDTDSDAALDVVEAICARKPMATVMVYAERNNPDLLMASMRAGAREFLSGVIPPSVMVDALLRAAARRVESATKKVQGKVLTFWGAKGGSGVTTLASNFAIALKKESGASVALLDFNPQLGDVSVLLGLNPRFTITDALLNPDRLDEDFISTLVTEHSSGLSVFAAPDAYTAAVPTEESTVGKFIELASSRFSYVVIDAGLALGKSAETMFQLAGTIYLVTQADIPSLRNTQRFVTYLKNFSGPEVELVLNRFEKGKMEFDEERLSKTVGLQPKWRVPNDYAAVRRASNTGTPLISDKSAIAGVLYQMARTVCGKLPENEKKKGFKLFG